MFSDVLVRNINCTFRLDVFFSPSKRLLLQSFLFPIENNFLLLFCIFAPKEWRSRLYPFLIPSWIFLSYCVDVSLSFSPNLCVSDVSCGWTTLKSLLWSLIQSFSIFLVFFHCSLNLPSFCPFRNNESHVCVISIWSMDLLDQHIFFRCCADQCTLLRISVKSNLKLDVWHGRHSDINNNDGKTSTRVTRN